MRSPVQLSLFSVSLRSADCGGGWYCFGVRLELFDMTVSQTHRRVSSIEQTTLAKPHQGLRNMGWSTRTAFRSLPSTIVVKT